MRKLSRREAHRLALHYAINDRDAYADCGDGEVSAEARRLAAEMRRVLAEEFGERTFEDALSTIGKPVSLSEIMRREPGDNQDFKGPEVDLRIKRDA